MTRMAGPTVGLVNNPRSGQQAYRKGIISNDSLLSMVRNQQGVRQTTSPNGGIFADVMQRYADANKANEDRYGQLLANNRSDRDALTSRFGEAMGALSSFGAGQRATIANTFGNQAGMIDQGAITSGLYNTTVRDAMRRRNDEASTRATLELEDAIANRKSDLLLRQAGAEAAFDRDRSGIIERRSDVGPDLGFISELIRRGGLSPGGGGLNLSFGGAMMPRVNYGQQRQSGGDEDQAPRGRGRNPGGPTFRAGEELDFNLRAADLQRNAIAKKRATRRVPPGGVGPPTP